MVSLLTYKMYMELSCTRNVSHSKIGNEVFGNEDTHVNIEEIIVVEGKDDTTAIKRAVIADTIETNGSAISSDTIRRIKLAQEIRGVIVFTDPDYPGRRIRAIIEEQIPGIKHAFLPKEKAIAKNGKSLGIEHAIDEDIRASLKGVYTPKNEDVQWEEVMLTDLFEARLIGHPDAKQRRSRLGNLLQIGYTNGKQLQKRLFMFKIERKQFQIAIEQLDREDNHA